MQVLREVTTSARRAIGLEPWGRMKIEYKGLDAGLPYIQKTAAQLGIPPEAFRDGVAAVLDSLRRKRLLADSQYGTFSRYWIDGETEIQNGYLAAIRPPQGTKLQRHAARRKEICRAMAHRSRRNRDAADRKEVGCPGSGCAGVP
ncbi:MAG UNVERIFIED_CONTAM: hypothetical protein LVR18_14950 [Planctomycetaceae bacterium]